jgi:hypothetical protein
MYLQDEHSSDLNVQYVEHANIVRYGNSAKAHISGHDCQQTLDKHNEGNILNLGFKIFGMMLFLHRDDAVESYDLSSIFSARDDFNYDILLLCISGIHISSKITAYSEGFFSLSFQNLGLFDLGDNGRR